MERKIGEEFDFYGMKLKVVESEEDAYCNGCFFYYKEFIHSCNLERKNIGNCRDHKRKDLTSVIFKRIK